MNSFLDAVARTVNPSTSPVGVNLIRDPASLSRAKVRLRDRRINICQQVAYSRYYGWSTWVDAAHSHCALGAAAAGLVALPERVRDGEVNAGVYQKDREAAARMQAALPRVPGASAVKGVLTYPAAKPVEGFSPEVVVVYVNSAQAMRFVQAFLFRDGGEFVMRTCGDAGVCSRGIAQPWTTGEPVVEIPCLGDRRFAMTQDWELLVGIPACWFDRVTEGLEATHKAGIRYPIPFQMPDSCDLPEPYTVREGDR
jgi:uncharacterized protein (DUF169 family)